MAAFLVLLTVVAGLAVLPLLGSFFGAVCGWFVGLVFGDTILGIAAQLGIRGITMWQLGCFLGFVGGFFRGSCSSSSKE